jgi:hypothetical protein
MPIVVVILVVLVVGGDLLWNSFHEKKLGRVSQEKTTKDAVKQSRSESDLPDYLNEGRFSGSKPLPP